MPPSIRRTTFRIEIRNIEPPFERTAESELEWICQSLGLSPVDKDKATVDIFKIVVKHTESGKGISSTDLASEVNMSRGAVIHHLNNLQLAGLVVKDGRLYFARSRSMVRTIQEVEADILRVFARMQQTAREIDKAFEMEMETRTRIRER